MHWNLRDWSDIPKYTPESSLFTIALHHGGKFQSGTEIDYVDGSVNYFDNCDPEELNYLSIVSMCSSLGWLNVRKTFYKPTFAKSENDLFNLKYDKDVESLHLFADSGRIVDIYCLCDNDDVSDGSSSDGEFVEGEEEELETEFGTDDDIGKPDNLGKNDETLVDTVILQEGVGGSGNAFGRKKGLKDNNCRSGRSKLAADSFGGDECLEEGYVSSSSIELDSVCGSDEEDNGGVRLPHFSVSDLKKPITWQLGMKFPSGDLFRKAVKEYAIQKGKDVMLTVNCRVKMYVYCQGKCPFMIYCAKMRDEETVQIRTLLDKHTCPRTQVNRSCKPKYLAERFMDDIRDNPKWDPKAFHIHVKKKTQCKISLAQAYNAFSMAKKQMQGTSIEQYSMLYDYIEELKRTNPGSTFVLKKKGNDTFSVFRGFYLCWGALKRGFLEGCRPVIGVDGCHLTGPHKGFLLTAVGIDANNCMFPFAYAVVGQEKQSTWKWFLKLLSKDLDIERASDYTFISDKQKGLILAMEQVLPGVEHRFCVRHLYNNFKMLHKGLALKNLLWKCARAPTKHYFTSALEEMKALDEEAYKWLASKPGENWSRSHFCTNCKSDILLNNLCESFNACIKDARSKPILTMLAEIRLYLMDVIMRKKEAMRKKQDIYLCPKIQSKLDDTKQRAHELLSYWNGEDDYECEGFHNKKYVVNLQRMECACNVWQLTGIPCVHAISAINHTEKDVESFVHLCYTREVYMKTYSNCLMPINGRDLWPESNKRGLNPPVVTIQPGRPKKIRKRGIDEPRPPSQLQRLGKVGIVMKCTKCGKAGHNSRTCGKPPKVRTWGKGIRKRKAKVLEQHLVDELTSESEAENERNENDRAENEILRAENERVENERVGDENERVQAERDGDERVAVENERDGDERVEDENERVQVERDGDERVAVENERDGDERVGDENERVQVERDGGERVAVENERVGVENERDEDEYWESLILSDNLWREKTNTQAEESSRLVSSQPLKTTKKSGPTKKIIKKQVRRSSRILESPKKGPPTVYFEDLTKQKAQVEAGRQHCGIIPASSSRLGKGKIFKNGKFYTTVEALKADVAHQKKEVEKQKEQGKNPMI